VGSIDSTLNASDSTPVSATAVVGSNNGAASQPPEPAVLEGTSPISKTPEGSTAAAVPNPCAGADFNAPKYVVTNFEIFAIKRPHNDRIKLDYDSEIRLSLQDETNGYGFTCRATNRIAPTSTWPSAFNIRRCNVTYLDGGGAALGEIRVPNYVTEIRFRLWDDGGPLTIQLQHYWFCPRDKGAFPYVCFTTSVRVSISRRSEI
jgi:hypothetical protein